MADFWNTDWLNHSPMFAPLRPVAERLPAIGWPDVELLSGLAEESGRRVVNAQGQQLRFVPHEAKPKNFERGFEQRAYLRGEVQVRPFDWHDLFNALVWISFPTTKAVINARHFESLSEGGRGNRPPQRDALTLFDEDGVAVFSSNPELLDLVRDFRWKTLFWERRDQVRECMRFVVFGHALYRKALMPFVGLTGKAVLLEVPRGFLEATPQAQIEDADRRLSAHIWDRARMCSGRELAPLPALGVPGWWPANGQESFYDNTVYFRPGRQAVMSSR
jgi:hypothetical protein